jgi:PAS domain S-box-containing protein
VYKRIFIALTIVLTGACAFLFNLFYEEAKNTAITKLNEEQMIHVKQAERGIEDFFATWTRSLNSLSKIDEIDTDAVGKRYLKVYYEAHQELVRSITRLDERGVILYNFPSINSVGTDISDQKHVLELLRDHKPVISDVFRAVEGFDAVALHVPIFRGAEFKGSIGILINFESLANRYLDVIKIGATGYAWVISRDGTQLYSPIAGFTGKSVFETIKDSPSLIVMVNDMLKGREGSATYIIDRTRDGNAGQIIEYAVYMPVHIGSTFWSIAVASAEQDVLSGLISFRNKLAFVIGTLFICGMVFSTLGAKAWLIVKEEEKRKQTEKELQQNKDSLRIVEEQYRGIFENALEGIYQTSPQGQFLIVNPALAKMLGYDSPDDVVSSVRYSAHEIWANPNQRRDYIRLLEQNGVALNYECEFYRKDKTMIWVSLNSSRVVGPDGEMLYYSGFIEDISERRRVEQALAESRAQILAVFDSTNDLIWSVDPVNFGIVTWNSALADYFLKNWGIELRVGMPPEQLVPPEFVTTWKEFYSRALREDSFTTEYCVATGTTILLISFNLLKRDGEVFGISIFGKDITERKQAEEALRTSEERYRAFVANSSECIWRYDFDMPIPVNLPEDEQVNLMYDRCFMAECNEEMARLYGFSSVDEAIGVRLATVAPSSKSENVKFFRAFIDAGYRLTDAESVEFDHYGNLRRFSNNMVGIVENGNLLSAWGVSRNITEQKQAEQEIAQHRNELAHVARISTMSQLASSLAHELNQPLGAILRNAEAGELFLQDPSPDLDEVRAILADIRKDDQRAGAVIDRMRAWMKRREVELSFLSINLLADEVVTLVRPDVERRRVRLAVEIDPAMPPVHGDRVQLQQVLLNLLLNAMDALEDNPAARRLVSVRARSAGSTVEVAVSDTGCGISEDELLRVFEPFFTSKPNGLGMGLAISRSIIEAHGGRLWAENNAAGGTSFTFALPVAKGGDAT